MPKSQSLPIGTILDSGKLHYKIERVLGAGSYGITYLATSQIKIANVTSRVKFAIKELFLESCFRDGDGTTIRITDQERISFDEARTDFLNEAHRLVQLCNLTPYIVNVNESFEANGTAYFVMEYLDGGTVGKMAEPEALELIAKVAEGLGIIHNSGLLHLDIKPDNVILTRGEGGEDIPVIIDFGIAKHFDADGKPTSRIDAKGATKGYAPMEQYSGITTFSPKYDVYALGALLLYMLSGKNPPDAFEIGTNRNQLNAAIPPEVSDRTRRAIAHAMSPSAFERTPDTATFLSELGFADRVASGGSNLPPLPPADTDKSLKYSSSTSMSNINARPTDPIQSKLTIPQPVAPNNKKSKILIASIAGAIVAVAAICAMFFLNNNSDEKRMLPATDKNAPIVMKVRGVKFKMIPVEGGTFSMGASGGSAYSDESPVHEVTVSDFLIGETEVTQELWSTLVSTNPSYFGGFSHPVENVSWQDAQVFIEALNRETGMRFRLPTEAEWEFAARGGNKSAGNLYSGSDNFDFVGWTSVNSHNTTHPVKSKDPNELGLYDMTGNVWEWCADYYGKYDAASQENPSGPATGSEKIARGGSWFNEARMARPTNRGSNKSTIRANRIGFRLALDR